jgi:TusA-related sulfurtransferase
LCRRLKEQEKKVKGGEKIEVMIDGTDIETDIERFVSYIHTVYSIFYSFVF